MPGGADRIQVDIRCDGDEEQRVRETLAGLATISIRGGQLLAVEILSGDPPSEEVPLVVVGPDSEDSMLAAVEDGALGYLVESSSVEELEAALVTVAGGAAVIPPMMLGALLRHTVRRRQRVARVEQQLEVLTDRERQVIVELSLGHQRHVIAERLLISPETVRTHIQRAMAKLGVHTQNELMALLAPLERGSA